MAWTRGRTIGRGSTATVSIATSDFSGDIFAVKSTELSKSESLRREQSILSTLSCPQIVEHKGYEISSENGKFFYNLFMEYAPNGSIMDVINKKGAFLDEAMVRSFTREILLGLEFLHSNGIVHCDIKSQNILVTDNGVKIADLGCAKRADMVSTAAWSVAGTPVFMAPEVARGEQQNFPADIWALGCTVIEMATGKSPWAGGFSDPVSAMYRIGCTSDVPEIPRNISKKAEDFLRKCLKRNPVERWTATELLNHDFVKESNFSLKNSDGFKLETPTSILHKQVWDSMEEEMETIQIPSQQTGFFTNMSLQDRIRQLSGNKQSLSLKTPNWDWDETWVTVRSHGCTLEEEEDDDDDELLQTNCCRKDKNRVTEKNYDLLGDYNNPTSIRIQNKDKSSSNSCTNSTLSWYKTSSLLLLLLLFITDNNNNKYFFSMFYLLIKITPLKFFAFYFYNKSLFTANFLSLAVSFFFSLHLKSL